MQNLIEYHTTIIIAKYIGQEKKTLNITQQKYRSSKSNSLNYR